jgi:hypothetical protein
MKKLYLLNTLLAAFLCTGIYAQTNPTPHDLSAGDFVFTGFSDPESTEYPAHTQGWRFGAEPFSDEVGPATDDRVLVGQSVSATSGNIRNEGDNGISFLNSGSNHIGALALALNATGRENLAVSYTVEDIRADLTRVNGMVLQYRVGEEGNFTSIIGTTYLTDPEGLAPPQLYGQVALPAELNNEPVVQLRWLYFYESGGGARDRIKLDEITVTSDDDGSSGSTVDITFRVDMSEFTGTIQPEGMHIAGSFPTDTWTPGARPMTDEGDGIWSWTESLEPGFNLEYKFVLGDDWPAGDENMGGQPCGAPGTTNRSIIIGDENTILPAVCYNSCNPCDAVVETSAITFQVDMSQQTIAAQGVGLSGSFNGFAFEAMNDQGNGIYSLTLEIEQGVTVEYKYRNGEEFENPPAECGTGGFGNRQYTVPATDVELDVVCYGQCSACGDPGEEYSLSLSVDASDIDVDPAGMHIAGSFNDFTPAPMVSEGNGIYSFTASVEAGSTVLWKYLNGSTFDGAEEVPEACGEPDGFEGFNRIFNMPSEDTVLPTVCFASCEACGGQPDTYLIVFQLDASELDIDPAGIYIAGNFNAFSPEPMTDAGSGLYTFSTMAEAGSTVLWKYLNGADFSGVESVPSECGLDDGFGGFNRDFEMPAEPVVLDVVCFGSCEACTNSTSNVTRDGFKLYPNPNDGQFALLAPGSGQATLRIFDLQGRMVHSGLVNTSEGEVLDYSQAIIDQGYYLVELRYGSRIFSTRMVVQ